MKASTPAINIGHVMHARHAPVLNRFRYAMFTLRLPLSQLESAGGPLLGIGRWRLLTFLNRDHGRRDGSALLPWVKALLAQHRLECADGEVILQTMPRLLGYVFNPVSFYYCHDSQGALRAVLCEVTNTFGEHHDYLVAHPDGRPIRDEDSLCSDKCFHVSPFFSVRGRYEFRFSQRGDQISVAIDYRDDEQRLLSTRLTGRDKPLTTKNLLRAVITCPLLTFGVIARIHWQALRLAARRVPIFAKPVSPQQEAL